MSLDAVNPATGELLKTYDEMTPGETASAVEDAHAAWKSWRNVPFAERARPMKKAAALLRERKEEFARLMALEMGKPLKQGIAEAEKCALGCDYYAEHAEAHLAPEMVKTESVEVVRRVRAARRRARRHAVEFSVLAGVPVRRAGADGRKRRRAETRVECAAVVRSPSRTCSGRLDSRKACFARSLIGSRQVKAVIEHPLVSAVTLTGSTPAGKAVAAQAGAVLKKTVLELGGSDAYIMLEDADLESRRQHVRDVAVDQLADKAASTRSDSSWWSRARGDFTEKLRRAHEDEEDGRSACRRDRHGSAGARMICATSCTSK